MSNLRNTDYDHRKQTAAVLDTADSSRQGLRLVVISIGMITGLAAVSLFALNFSQPTFHLPVLGMTFLANALFAYIAVRFHLPRGQIFAALLVSSLLFGVATTSTAAFLAGLGLPVAIVVLIHSLLISSLLVKNWQANIVAMHGLIAAGASALLTEYSPVQQLSITVVDVVTPAILGILLMVYVTLLAMQFITATLRVRLVTAFLTIVLIPLAVLSLIQSGFMFNVLTSEVNRSMQLAAQQTAQGVDRFLNDSQRSVQDAAQLDVFRRYLELDELHRAGSPEEAEMRLTLRVLETNELNSTIYISSYALLNMKGIAVYDTLGERIASRFSPETLRGMGIDIDAMLNGEGVDEFNQLYFQVPAWKGETYISDLQVNSSTRSFLYISAPVRGVDGKVLGVLRARYDGLLLQDLLESYNGLLGSNSYAALLDEYNIRLADAYTPNYLYKAVAPLTDEQVRLLKLNNRLPDLPSELLSTQFTEFAGILNSYDPSNPVFRAEISPSKTESELSQIGAIFGIKSRPWKVVYLRTDFSEEELRREQRRLTLLVTVVIVMIVGFIAVIVSQLLSSPIIRLTRTAQQISAGDLAAQAPAQSADEYGMLGAAFNSMTTQLRTLISQLEERVRARTRDIEDRNAALSHRARQLQTVSDVARQIVSAQNLETLLGSVTQLISERFNFYHVGVFLLDEKGEYAVLRAANSEGGQRMLARSHRLRVGKVGIVGYATGMGQARIATDVGDDAVFFNNPDLPETRSEMALPLLVGGQTIGALDIQSVRSNDFTEDDIELFTTLADQVAIAIHNNRLYMQTLHALDEAQALHRQYLRQEWASETRSRSAVGYLYNQSGITAQQGESPLWRKVFSTGEPVYSVLPNSETASEQAVMAVPISVRGETIGVIHVQDQGDDRMWSEDEISMVNSIASQVAVALENARLFEATVRRAEREKKVSQITAKIRGTNDPHEMMQIAISELQQALHASRAQIYVRKDNEPVEAPASATNGRAAKNGREKPSAESGS